jgi:cytochrome c oxidase assembly protein subunit 15
MAVAMWAAGYVCRLPALVAPAPLLLAVLLCCPVAGGFLLARQGGTVRRSLYAGLLAGIVNLLVLGSLLGGDRPNEVRPSALFFVPGSIALTGVLAAAGGIVGGRSARSTRTSPDWTAVFAGVAVVATFFLLIVGGVVTSTGSGLAVVDWPNSYGYNMFLYPLSRMTGGIYYEHAHRLFGSLVGLVTIVLAAHLIAVDRRRTVRLLVLLAVLLVVAQGIVGGLRVTGRFTSSAEIEDTSPDIRLAVVHGVLGQVFFASMVSLAVLVSKSWREPERIPARPAADRALGAMLLAALIAQLVLGAVQRHLASGLLIHVTMGFLVTTLAVAAGARAWGLYGEHVLFRRFGPGLLLATGLQLVLGLGALLATGEAARSLPPWIPVTVRTAHQANGAVVLAIAVGLLLWSVRLLGPESGQFLREGGAGAPRGDSIAAASRS